MRTARVYYFQLGILLLLTGMSIYTVIILIPITKFGSLFAIFIPAFGWFTYQKIMEMRRLRIL